jgi:hypothetical protein
VKKNGLEYFGAILYDFGAGFGFFLSEFFFFGK